MCPLLAVVVAVVVAMIVVVAVIGGTYSDAFPSRPLDGPKPSIAHGAPHRQGFGGAGFKLDLAASNVSYCSKLRR